jgi:DNA-binding response OmpR family regulator
MKGLILLVEDNAQIMRGNERMLKRQGYEVAAALTLAEAWDILSQRKPDAIVLDIMLPDGSGLDFMRKLREAASRQTSKVPILLLTGLTTPADVVRGLVCGGDDYLGKPYDFGVLLARIEALLRRASQVPELLTIGSLRFDILANQAFLNGEDLLLTQKEFALLFVLAKSEKRPLSTEYLHKIVWNLPEIPDDTKLKVHLSRLRKKLGENFVIQYETDEYGYIFEEIA